MERELTGYWLGRRRYAPVHALQQRLFSARMAGNVGDTLLLVEHDPVITQGRGAHAANVLLPREALEQRGIDVVVTERGGDVTLHAPGQLVAYPILELAPERRDVRRYVRDLITVMQRVTADYGVASGPSDEYVGLWVDAHDPSSWPGSAAAARPEKIGAVGVRLSRWVTMHGFALNLTTDLALYGLIVPCGISHLGVTSIARLVGATPTVEQGATGAFRHFCDVFGRERGALRDASRMELGELFSDLPLTTSAP